MTCSEGSSDLGAWKFELGLQLLKTVPLKKLDLVGGSTICSRDLSLCCGQLLQGVLLEQVVAFVPGTGRFTDRQQLVEGLAAEDAVHCLQDRLVLPRNMALEVPIDALQHDEELPHDLEEMWWGQPLEGPPVPECGLEHIELPALVYSQQVLTASHPENLDIVPLGQVRQPAVVEVYCCCTQAAGSPSKALKYPNADWYT